MNETSLNPSPITWTDLPVTATVSRVSSLVDRYSLLVAGRECATILFFHDGLAGLVDVHFSSESNDQILLAVGRLLHSRLGLAEQAVRAVGTQGVAVGGSCRCCWQDRLT